MAGLATVPLSVHAADPSTSSLPNGSASASALKVTVSLAPLKNAVDLTKAASDQLGWQAVASALKQVHDALCPSGTGCPLGLDIPTDLPDTLNVYVAQARDEATM